ncbi:16704_t:CDS:2 [Rhizophagus irregularis]|nr:16704_t:CDS:2 [Rhizophagus irregularis]
MSESKNPISFILKKPNAKPGRKPKEVWNFFTAIGEKKEGHRGCKCKYCPWSQTRGEPSSMEAHLALSCHKTPQDVKEKFLLIVKTRGESQTLQLEAAEIPSKKRKAGHQQLITKYGIGLRSTILRNVYILTMKIWIDMGGGELSSADLISQIQSFYLKKEEYNIPYSASRGDVLTWWILCNPVRNEENHIQKLALKILAITPHNAGCERVFSVLGWFANQRRSRLKVEKLEAMAKLHTHYITNAQKELNHDSNIPNQRDTEIEKWVNINDLELKKLLNIEVNVVIEPHPLPVINHGSNVFDVEATVDRILGS